MATDARVCPHPTELLQNATFIRRGAMFRCSARMRAFLVDCEFWNTEMFRVLRGVRLPSGLAQECLDVNDFQSAVGMFNQR